MKTLSTTLYTLLLLGFTNCQTEIYEGGGAFSKSYVNRFIKATSIAGDYQNDWQAIQIVAKGDVVSNSELDEFIELINHFGDNAYNTRRMVHPFPAIANEFDVIEVTSNKNFSEDLPAGASLAGVLKLIAISPAKYIKSKYTEPFNWAENEPEEFKELSFNNHRGYYPVLKTVSELTAEDMLLINPDLFFLRFTEIPSIKEHTFTITLKYGEKSLSADVDVVFE